jgi:gliding motility-associated-like protein
MKNSKYILGIFSLLSMQAFSQDVLVVDGGSIHVTNNGLLTVKGGVVNQNSGTIDNSGDITVSGDWTNNANNTMLVNNSQGNVTLDGNNQSIKGTSITDFYNLKLDGGSTVKSMELDANVSNELDLGDEELQTNSNTIFVNNPAVGSVVWNTGYVNSDSLGGYLARATNSTGVYTFPVGSSLLTDSYRPVFLTPTSANANVYGVRLSDESPDTDNTGTSNSGAVGPFPIANKEAQVRAVNNEYYFNISRLIGSDAVDVQVDFFNADGDYQTLAQWSGANAQWEGLDFNYAPSTTGANLNSPDVSLSKTALNDFNHDVFALAELEFDIEVPGGVSPNADGFNDNFVVENLEYFPENELVIFNRWGDVVYEASPYLNDWSGQVNGSMILAGTEVSDGTYFYVLKLSPDETTDPIKGSFELRRK